MSCEICGRSACTRSFHSLEEQENFDNKADDIKDRMRNVLISRINNLECEEMNSEYFVKLEDVEKIINDY